MSSERNIIVVGASFAGVSAAHYVLKHVLPSLPKEGKYRLVLINPATHMFHVMAVPRLVASPELLPPSKAFNSIEDGFKQYGKDRFSFIQAKATNLNTAERTLTFQTASGAEDRLPYHALILASGTRTSAPYLSSQTNPHEETKKALSDINSQIKKAKTIIIGGGGPAGVETAGEIGEAMNGTAGWFASRPSKQKVEITVITGAERLLPVLRPASAQQAETYLNRVGVDVVYNTRITSASTQADGKTKVILSNGKEMEADVYIPATGTIPNSEFVPKQFLDEKAFVITNVQMRVDKASSLYAVGDVASYGRGGILDMFEAVPVLGTNLKRDLLASDAGQQPTGGDRSHKPLTAEGQLVPIGRSKGVGAFNGNKLPSMMVWAIKGRDYMLGQSPEIISGKKWTKEKSWKPTDAQPVM